MPISAASLPKAAGLGRGLGHGRFALVAASAASILFATFACDRFLRAAGLDFRGRLTGLLFWFLLPPIHNAYVLPVQTKEDFLAYGILFMGLRAVLLGQDRGVLIWTALGALTRETLMLIPLAYVLGSRAPWQWKVAAFVLGASIHVFIRAVMGISGYGRRTLFRSSLSSSASRPCWAMVGSPSCACSAQNS